MELADYRALPPLLAFGDLADLQRYTPVPRDWWVIVTDVRGSTAAIEAGRYREVNQVGAMGIAALKNVLRGQDFPYVFGGDGATFALPAADAQRALPALQGVKATAAARFGLDLRVGAVPLAALGPAHALLIARFALSPGLCTALFAGGALAAAEALIKADPDRCLPAGDPAAADLTGLSCRWAPIPAARGVTLSLLVRAEDPRTYREVLTLVEARCPQLRAPLDPARLRLGPPAAAWADEARLSHGQGLGPRLRRFMEVCMLSMAYRVGLPPLAFDPQRYLDDVPAHSDHKKFDELLRMVVDCSPDDRAHIEAQLSALQAEGRLVFGSFASTHALMTCLVDHMGPGGHVHFIDGGDGGYAMAAKVLKARLRLVGAHTSPE